MTFFEKISEFEFILRINVKPNSRKQKILKTSEQDDYLTVLLRSKPLQNKANIELLNLIKKIYSVSTNQIKFLSGQKSANKILKIQFQENIQEKEFTEKIFKLS